VIRYCEIVKNVTVSLDDATYRNARRRAAEADRSLSSVVREMLQSYGAQESEFDRLAREEDEIRARIKNFNGGDRLTREELYDRDARRAEHEAALAKDRRRGAR
jgi:cell division protein FtsB